jgi:chitodextrinase
MPVGDSITRGASNAGSGVQGTYRYYLSEHLNASEVDFDYVGPYVTHPAGAYLHQGQWNHSSHAVEGWEMRDIRGSIAGAMLAHEPDILLMIAGTNDMRSGYSVDLTISRLSETVSNARAVNPEIGIILAEIPPNSLNAAGVVEYNTRLRVYAQEASTAASPIHTVDLHTGFDLDGYTYDRLHPNDTGDRWIADRFASGLHVHFGVGEAPPSEPDVQLEMSQPSVTAGVDAATVTWSTNVPANSTVRYGTTQAYELGSAGSSSLTTAHRVVVSGLTASTTYHYQATSQDADGRVVAKEGTFTTSAPASSGGFRSDDFALGLDSSVWTVVDPLGDGTVAVTTTGDRRHLELSVPAGTSHDPWGTDRSLRTVQNVSNRDVEIEVRFDSVPSTPYQMQGLMFAQDAANWLRFEFHHNGTSLQAFAASTTSGQSSARLNASIASTSPSLWLRVTRSGDLWTLSWSPDGASFSTVGGFSRSLVLATVGPFVANHASPQSASPGFTARVDYVLDTASPIDPSEPPPADTTPPTISGVSVAASSDRATVTWNTDEPATSGVSYGLTTNLELGEVYSASLVSSHSVTLSGLQPSTTYRYRVTSRDAAGNTATTSLASFTTTAAPPPSAGPSIAVWHGDGEVFGRDGRPQRWVNILGNVKHPNGMSSLRYRLNGGSEAALSLGPDLRRLQFTGDFNVELDVAVLRQGENTVELIARGSDGSESRRTVTFSFSPGSAPSLPATWDFGTQGAGAPAMQFVDGRWTTTSDALRTLELGYDRTFVLGDTTWTDYEVEVEFTVHGLGPDSGTPWSGEPLIGMGLRWIGHTPESASQQPSAGFYPVGAYAWYRWEQGGRHQLTASGGSPIQRIGGDLPFGVRHIMKASVETTPSGSRYRYKSWVAGQSEPNWQLDLTYQGGTSAGGVVVLAHHVDASFNRVTVRPNG